MSASDYSARYQSDPWTMARARAMQTQAIGMPGLATGNPMVDMMFSMMMGNSVLPQAATNQSQMEALTIRRRSLEGFNRIAMQGYGNNAVANNFGGFGGIIPYSAMMADQATGGIGNGAVSRFMAPLLGGSPILAEQKLYAGLNGMTRMAAFGLRGEANINDTGSMMRGMQGWFYNQGRNNEDFDRFAKSKNVSNSEVLRKKLEGKSGDDIDKAIEEYIKVSGDKIDDAMARELKKRARTTKYGNINFQNTYGYNVEDITGSFVALGQNGLFAGRRGMSGAAAFNEFGAGGGMGMVRAAHNLFGSASASDAVRDMNSFLGVSSFNAADAKDRDRFETMAHKFEAASLSTGIEKGDLLQLVEAIREVSKQARNGTVIGGMEAGGLALRAVASTQSMLMLDKNNTAQDYMRRHGGLGGVTQTAAAQFARAAASAPSNELHGLMGAVDRFMADGPAKDAAKKSILSRIDEINANPALATASGSIAFKEQLAKQTGLPLGGMGMDIANKVNTAKGLAIIQRERKDYDPSGVTGAAEYAYMMKYGEKDGISRKDMDDILGSATSEEAIARYRQLAPNSVLTDDRGVGLAMTNSWNVIRAQSTKGKAAMAAEQKRNTFMSDISKDLEREIAGARTSMSGAFGRSLLSGEAFGGLSAVMKERLGDASMYGTAAANFANNFSVDSKLGELLGSGGVAGALNGITSRDITETKSGAKGAEVDWIKNTADKFNKIINDPTATAEQKSQAKRGLDSLLDKDGRYQKKKWQSWAGRQMYDILSPDLLKNEEMKRIKERLDSGMNAAMEKYGKGDIITREQTGVDDKGDPIYKNVKHSKKDLLGKKTSAELKALSENAVDENTGFLLKSLSELRGKAESSMGEAEESTESEIPEVMQKLIDIIGGEGGLIQNITDLSTSVQNAGATGANR